MCERSENLETKSAFIPQNKTNAHHHTDKRQLPTTQKEPSSVRSSRNGRSALGAHASIQSHRFLPEHETDEHQHQRNTKDEFTATESTRTEKQEQTKSI